MIEDLARMILEAQRIREESWDGVDKYTKSHEEAVKEAGETSGLDTRADELVYILQVVAWNDSQAWAERCLEGPSPNDYPEGGEAIDD